MRYYLNKRPFTQTLPYFDIQLYKTFILCNYGEGRTEADRLPHFSTMNYTKFLFWIIAKSICNYRPCYYIYTPSTIYGIIYYSAIPLYTMVICFNAIICNYRDFKNYYIMRYCHIMRRYIQATFCRHSEKVNVIYYAIPQR